jgi:hypothetical protein
MQMFNKNIRKAKVMDKARLLDDLTIMGNAKQLRPVLL